MTEHGSAGAGPTLPELEEFLDRALQVARRDGGEGILVPRTLPVRRFGLSLDPGVGFGAWVEEQALDAVFLHRHWRLAPEAIPPGVGVLAYHEAFDRSLALGYNPRLAEALGLADLRPLGERDGAPLGMHGTLEPRSFSALVEHVTRVFGGVEAVVPPATDKVARVAVMSAMTAALVERAAAEGVNAYLTGQMRVPAREAVARTGIGVAAMGHHRSEQWGLGALADLLRREWPMLRTAVRPLG
jgi:putative NIF3 family GTP cyclohydrolase 1 type 2